MLNIISLRHLYLRWNESSTLSVQTFEVGMKICQKSTRKNDSTSEISAANRIPRPSTLLWSLDCAPSVSFAIRMTVFLFPLPSLNLDLCPSCRAEPAQTVHVLSTRSQRAETSHSQVQAICSDCCGIPLGEEVACDSRDCPVFYSRLKAVSLLETSLTRDAGLLETFNEWKVGGDA